MRSAICSSLLSFSQACKSVSFSLQNLCQHSLLLSRNRLSWGFFMNFIFCLIIILNITKYICFSINKRIPCDLHPAINPSLRLSQTLTCERLTEEGPNIHKYLIFILLSFKIPTKSPWSRCQYVACGQHKRGMRVLLGGKGWLRN